MSEKKTKKNRIQQAVLLRTIIPMLMMGMIIAIFVFYGYKNSIRTEIENSLAAVAASVAGAYDEIYPGDYYMKGEKIVSIYKGNTDITGEYKIIDRVKEETGMDITLFYQNTRILTTLQDSFGGRYIQTGINAGLFNDISTSDKAICYRVNIDGIAYYACYLPLYNKDEVFAGIIAAAVKEKEIDSAARTASFPIILITLLAVLVTGVISYSYTKNVADSIYKIRKFLKSMVNGKLDNDMPRTVLIREDELGETGKSVVDMQNAIRVLVERDPLTSLYNRRYGGAKLRNVQKHANKCGVPYAVCICDIDFFKRVNDTYGHEAGDIVLKKVADIMRKAMSGKGFCARWGGEEFLLIFDKVDIKGATVELQNILDTIRKTEIPYDNLIIKITMSFGVVDGDQSEDYGALLRHADERLYSGKMNGRNQVVNSDDLIRKMEAEKEAELEAKSKAELEGKNAEREAAIDNNAEKSEDKAENSGNKGNRAATRSEEKNVVSEFDKEEEFLARLVQKMSEQLYNKTLNEEEDNKDKDNKDGES